MLSGLSLSMRTLEVGRCMVNWGRLYGADDLGLVFGEYEDAPISGLKP